MDIINLDAIEADTADWQDYCLGYHSMKVPPGLTAYAHPSTHVDWHYPLVVRNYGGSARDYIEGHRRFGAAIFATQLNGWDFMVAKERANAKIISDFSLVFYGARKWNDDLILFYRDASVSRVGDGSDPKYRQFYADLHVEPVTAQNRSNGFCYDGYVFSGYEPKHVYNFNVGFGGVSTNGRNGYQFNRHGIALTLSQEWNKPPKDDRPVALPPSIDQFPHILDVEHSKIVKNGYNGLFTRIAGVGDDAHRVNYEALIEGPSADPRNPVYSVETYDDVHPMSPEDGLGEFLAFIDTIKAN